MHIPNWSTKIKNNIKTTPKSEKEAKGALQKLKVLRNKNSLARKEEKKN